MGLALKCLEHVTAFGCVTAAYLVGNLDPGLTALGVVSGAAIIVRFKEHCIKHGLDEPALLSKMQMVVLRDWDTVDQTHADRDAIVEADSAMRAHLLDCMLTREELAGSSVSTEHYPKRAARLVTDRMAEHYNAFGAPTDSVDGVSVQRRFALTVIENALKAAMDDQAYAARLMLDLLIAGNAAHAVTHDKVDEVKAETKLIRELLEAGPLAHKIRASGIDQRPFVLLARKINQEVDDETQALAELSAAVEELLALQVTAVHGTNYETLVDQVLRRMAEQSLRGDFDAAADEGSRAFAEWEERQEVGRQSGITLVTANIQQNMFRRDVNGVAEWVMRRLMLESISANLQFETLYNEINVWLDSGRRKGSQIDLLVAITMSSRVESLSENKAELARAQNLRGIVLWRLGEIKSGTEELYLAIRSFDAAIENRPRSKQPIDWAKSQISKAGAWFRIGHRDDRSDGLIEAANCSHLALEVCTPRNAPFEWAAAHNNLGNALFIRGERTCDADLVKEAIGHFNQSLRIRTKAKYEASWSMTKMNIGCAYSALGDLVAPKKHHRLAVGAMEQAISVRDRAEAPYDWARAASNLGVALCRLGVATQCRQTLERALSIQSEALAERPLDRVPLEWSNSATELAWTKFRILELDGNFTGVEEIIALAKDAILVAGSGQFSSQAEDGKKLLKLIASSKRQIEI